MSKLIPIIIILMSIIDLTSSYFYFNTFHAKFPKLDYTQLEANPIIRYSMKQFGLTIGMIFGGLIVLAIVSLISFNLEVKWQYYLMGLFSMMIVYHTLNFAQLARMAPA